MKNVIFIRHPDKEGNQNTFLDAPAYAGDTTITVRNITGFSTNQILLIGEYATEIAEIVKTHSTIAPSGNTITLASALKQNHSTHSIVWLLDWDKIRIYRKTPPEISFTLIDEIDITPDQPHTVYSDNNGSLESEYKFEYKNSITNQVSLLSDIIPATGFPLEALWGLVEKAYTLFGRQAEKKFTKDWVVEWINEGYRICISKIIQLDNEFYLNEVIFNLQANKSEYLFTEITSKNVRRVKTLEIDYDNNGNFIPAEFITINTAPDFKSLLRNNPVFYLKQNSIVIEPSRFFTDNSRARMRYIYIPADLSSDAHIPELPKEYALNLVNWALYRMHQADGKHDIGIHFRDLFTDGLTAMISDLQKRHPSLARQFRFPADLY
ncbi:MAG: hypothetical protein ABIL76_04170 [candidate division WOR-3 bacterium]